MKPTALYSTNVIGMENILEKVHSLDAMLIIPTYEEVVKARSGPDDEAQQPKEEQAVRSRPSTAAKEGTTDASSPECPSGGTFGKDCNQLEACDSCDENLHADCGIASAEQGKSPEGAEEKSQPVRRRRNI